MVSFPGLLMKVKVLYFARLREIAQKTEEEIEAEGTVNDALEQVKLGTPSLCGTIETLQSGASDIMIALNMCYITDLTTRLVADSELAFIPPIGGG